MNANELIDCYVNDVAVQLPRKQRNDVAFELRALLTEELHAKAEEQGRAPDAAMATAFLQAFGRPADVAARYQPALIIIDPADGHSFLRATVIGLLVIWGVGLLVSMGQPIASASDFFRALGHWWGSAVIPSLWWPGMLVLGYGGASWVRQRWPQSGEWKPRPADRIAGSGAALVLGMVGVACGLYVLSEPRWVLDVVWGGAAAPAAYEALTYTDAFRTRQAPLLFLLLLANIPMWAVVLVRGRWTPMIRRLELQQCLVLCAVMLWTVFDGPIFMAHSSDSMTKFIMVLIVIYVLLDLGIKLQRRVSPRPA